MENREKILLGTACFLGGVVAGFLIAPIKKGIYCGNNSGNSYLEKKDSEEIDEFEEFTEKEEINNL
ncbi:MAG: hypothetical protein ACRDD2_07620 [Sarcina sp.]